MLCKHLRAAFNRKTTSANTQTHNTPHQIDDSVRGEHTHKYIHALMLRVRAHRSGLRIHTSRHKIAPRDGRITRARVTFTFRTRPSSFSRHVHGDFLQQALCVASIHNAQRACGIHPLSHSPVKRGHLLTLSSRSDVVIPNRMCQQLCRCRGDDDPPPAPAPRARTRIPLTTFAIIIDKKPGRAHATQTTTAPHVSDASLCATVRHVHKSREAAHCSLA